MRFILFCIATLVSYCFVQGQGHYPLLAKNEKIKLTDALKSIEVSRKIHFAFDPQACSQYVVQVKSPDLSTDELLNELLFNLPISYAKQDLEHYLISKNSQKLLKSVYYDVNGNVINSSDFSQITKWKSIVPGSILEAVRDKFTSFLDS